MKRSFTGVVAAVLLACAVAAPQAGAGAYVPGSVSAYGMGSLKSEWLAGYNAAEGLDRNGLADLDLLNQANIGLYRARFRQDRAKTATGYTQWTQTDLLVGEAAKRGVSILPILINMPGEAYTPPKTAAEIAAFAEFARQAVLRYGPTGKFWTTCACTRRPIQVWQVWNEPNRAGYWAAASPDPRGYAQMLTAVRASLRQADPAARILF